MIVRRAEARVARDENLAAGVSPPARIDFQNVEARLARDTFLARVAYPARSTLVERMLQAA